MGIGNDRQRWGALAMALHWLSALLVLALLVLGFTMVEAVEDLALKFRLYQLHKSIGFSLFVLVLLRLGWRLTQPVPDLPAELGRHERLLARLTHGGLYALLLAMPVAGWISAGTSPLGIRTRIFGLFTLPSPFVPDEALHEISKEAHELLAVLLIGLVVLHVAAALRHHVLSGDDVLRRMLPGYRPESG